jgi:hypothetical protein
MEKSLGKSDLQESKESHPMICRKYQAVFPQSQPRQMGAHRFHSLLQIIAILA